MAASRPASMAVASEDKITAVRASWAKPHAHTHKRRRRHRHRSRSTETGTGTGTGTQHTRASVPPIVIMTRYTVSRDGRIEGSVDAVLPASSPAPNCTAGISSTLDVPHCRPSLLLHTNACCTSASSSVDESSDDAALPRSLCLRECRWARRSGDPSASPLVADRAGVSPTWS